MQTIEKRLPKGWCIHAPIDTEFEAFVDESDKHSGTRCATLRTVVEKPKPFGNLMQTMTAAPYVGKRLRMSAWVKSKLEYGRSQLWVRIDGDWRSASSKPGCFDNMDDRPIKGETDWSKYELVVQVPDTATDIAFGLMLAGKGQVWLDDVSFEEVDQEVPLTGSYVKKSSRSGPINLNFEEGSW